MSRRLLLCVALFALLLAGCKLDTTVTIDMRDDGSGTVTVDALLDAGAVQAVKIEDKELDESIRLTDLSNAGWKITPWVTHEDGSASMSMSKTFTSPDQVAGILAEISGAEGPVRDVTASRERKLLSTEYAVNGAIDLGAITTGVVADQDLVNSLAGQQIDVNALDASLQQQLKDALSVQVVVNLPGGSTTITGVAGQRTEIDASTSVRDTRRIVLILVAVGLVIVAIVVWFGGRHSRYRHRSRQPIPRFDPHSRRG